jgi:hypothetical protein
MAFEEPTEAPKTQQAFYRPEPELTEA